MEENKMLYFITLEPRREGKGLQQKLRAVAAFFSLAPMFILSIFSSDWTQLNLRSFSHCTYADQEQQSRNTKQHWFPAGLK